jgi:hypothetical protein
MSSITKYQIKLNSIGFFLCLSCVSLLSQAAEYPAGWPWHGIVTDVLGGDNDPSAVPKLAQMGVNSIELVLSVRSVAKYQNKTPAVAWNDSIAWADKMLDACKANGIVGIVTFVQIPTDPALNLNQMSPELWNNPALLSEAVTRAGQLADHFKTRGTELGAYEILNEPIVHTSTSQYFPTNYPALMQQVITEIRSKDPKRWIVITAGIGGEANQYQNFKPLSQPRIIYGAHVYNPHNFTHQGIYNYPLNITWPGMINGTYWDKSQLIKQIQPLITFKNAYNVPVWIGEFSSARWASGAETYLKDAVSIFNQNGFGWMYFQLNGYYAWNPDYDTVYATDADSKYHYVGDSSARWATLRQIYSPAQTTQTPTPTIKTIQIRKHLFY